MILLPNVPTVPAMVRRARPRWNRVRNGRFTDDRIWSWGGGWTHGALQAVRTATGAQSSVAQSVTLVVGASYRLSFSMTRSAGALTPRFEGGTTVLGAQRPASGTYTETLVAVAGNNVLAFNATAAFAGTLSNVWLERIA